MLTWCTFSDYHVVKPNELTPDVYAGDEPVVGDDHGLNVHGLFLDGILDTGWLYMDLCRLVCSRLSKN